MKTNLIKRMICILLFSIAIVQFSNARNTIKYPSYTYSNQGAKELAETQIISQVDRTGKYLSPLLKYEFTYDDKNQLLSKEAFRWNIFRQIWEQSFHLKFSYQENTVTAEYARWDYHKKSYQPYTQKAVYKINNDTFTTYSFYIRNSSTDEWILEKKLANNSILLWNEHNLYIAEE